MSQKGSQSARAQKGFGQGKHSLYPLISTSVSHWLNSIRSQRSRELVDAVQEGQHPRHRVWEKRVENRLGGMEYMLEEGDRICIFLVLTLHMNK